MNNPVFLLGMRRSGTSLLRRLCNMAPGTELLFEPHELWFAITHSQIKRYEDEPLVKGVLEKFRKFCCTKRNAGFKYVFNPEIRAFEWPILDKYYPEARYIFIRRKQRDTYRSYFDQDKKAIRGTVPSHIHRYFWTQFYAQAERFVEANKDRSVLVEYEDLVLTKGGNLGQVWKLLDTATIDVRPHIHFPSHWTEAEFD